ncbi:hypothetical protein AALP_AA7G180300 [Arabis alpina]|uniref:Uncharacterized protein n=1 Tax=Arabis alpina TaxID=50452 RepID=A0A087GIU2_ARAAL|nr:hypothetical protein AALP_AA7G180300 [Arabis alpina]
MTLPEPHERPDDPPEGDRPSTEGSEQLEDSLGFAQSSRVQLEERFFTTTCRESESFPWGSSVSSFRFSDCSGDIQSEMERLRSFRNLAPKTTGNGKPPTPTTVTTSTAPTAVPTPAKPTTAPASASPTTAPASARQTTVSASAKPTTAPASARPTIAPSSKPRDTFSAKKTTTAAKGSHLPSATRTELVAALPASLPSDYDAKRAAKRKGHEGDDRKRSSDRDDVIEVD